jgi:quercetin dioxygenase-like cupin family protein
MRVLVIGIMLTYGILAHAQDKGAKPAPGKTVTIKTPPLPPSTDEALAADVATAAWTPGDKLGYPKAQVALIGMDPMSTGLTVYLKVPAGWKLPMHSHLHHEYLTLVSGKATATAGGKAHTLTPGSYAVTPPKATHDLACDAGAECVFIVRRNGPADVSWVNPPK